MCFSSTKTPPVVTRPDPNIKYVDGNIMNPKDSPPEIDKTPVKKPEKKNKTTEIIVFDDSIHFRRLKVHDSKKRNHQFTNLKCCKMSSL